MTTRVSPPANSKLGVNPITVNGRLYNVAVGSTQDVPDHDAYILTINGWHSHGQVTTTAARPTTGISKGAAMVDSTLGAVILYDGTQWRNWLTGAVV